MNLRETSADRFFVLGSMGTICRQRFSSSPPPPSSLSSFSPFENNVRNNETRVFMEELEPPMLNRILQNRSDSAINKFPPVFVRRLRGGTESFRKQQPTITNKLKTTKDAGQHKPYYRRSFDDRQSTRELWYKQHTCHKPFAPSPVVSNTVSGLSKRKECCFVNFIYVHTKNTTFEITATR